MFSQIPNLACFALCLLSGITQGQTYDGYSTSALIPWTGGHKNFDVEPHVRIRIASLDGSWISPHATGYWQFTVDTGTCGIMTTEAKSGITTAEKTPENRGWEYLSSSHVLYAGYWVERSITFTESQVGGVTTPVLTKVKILSVHTKYENCIEWNEGDEDECRDPRSNELDAEELKTRGDEISMLGIGYGHTYDGQPQGTPDKNPLLNLERIGTDDLSTAFHPGWRIDEEGIKLGLTNTVWGGMSSFERQLAHMPVPPPSSTGINPHYPWPEVRGCVSFSPITDVGCVSVALLLDTGMDWSSIRVDDRSARAVRISDDDHRLRNGQSATILVGGLSIAPPLRQVLASFTYGPAIPPVDCDVTPQRTEVSYDSAKRNFTNTGRHMFRRWAQGYDPWRGVIAFEKHRLISTRCAA